MSSSFSGTSEGGGLIVPKSNGLKITGTFLDEISHDIPHQNWGEKEWDRDFRYMMLFFHLICIVATNIDPKRKNISKKVFHVVMWICPVISLVNCNILYVYNLGYKLNIGFVCGLFVGILYLILGNFIPKVKPNYSIGFRIPWALNDSDNWYHTHRFGGKCMVIGGIAMIVTSPFQNVWIFLALVIVPCILPVVYSYMFYRKTME